MKTQLPEMGAPARAGRRRGALARGLARWLRDQRGGTAIVFAVAAPTVAILACGAVDLFSLSTDHSQMQDAADAAALDAAKQLGIGAQAGIAARADSFVQSQIPQVMPRVPYRVTTSFSPDNSQVTVRLDGHRESFFGNLLPPGGWDIHVSATAATLGLTPLCVLASQTGGQTIQMTNQAQTTAATCLVQSNGDIQVTNSAQLTAGIVQASGQATGAITPQAQNGAPTIGDPFASMTISKPLLNLCTPIPNLTAGLNILLATPTPYCGNITVRQGQTLQLTPGGTYYFHAGQLQLQQNAVLKGSNVTLIFDNSAQFQFDDSSTIDLTGATSGPYAGFVIMTTRDNVGTFEISSDSARRLEGTVYIPSAVLKVTGANNRVADQSAWTVVVAKSIQMSGSPNLVINANYASSSVPVPNGVGATGAVAKVKLQR
ncbi:TadE/TadG family type IV pilus assembly protein [Caulobacter sp. KR2-114]|uniref:TadE/TadG family type IV pilus assembly protein n=1 Tax=Caulobacter sp. KR2-114 TaxID=3400912 RepID=UPI003BFED2DD